jgi:hypothetical protein
MCRVVEKEHEHSRATKDMSWLALGEAQVVKTIILGDTSSAKRAAQCWAREKAGQVRVGVLIWWTDGLRSDNGRVGAATVCQYSYEWRIRNSYLGTELLEVFDAELWAIGLGLRATVNRCERL